MIMDCKNYSVVYSFCGQGIGRVSKMNTVPGRSSPVNLEGKNKTIIKIRAHPITKKSSVKGKITQNIWLYAMLLPGLLFFIVFKYGPILGLISAFQEYQPYLGFFKSKWVGLAHFHRFFSEPMFFLLLKNTIIISVYNLIFFFPLTIIISLLLNEVRGVFYKRVIQTLIYIPHFFSWVVIASITYTFFTIEGGLVNNVLVTIGMDKINPLMSIPWFRPMIVLQTIWKETGWGTIIILAALAGIQPELYSAAEIDGAGRWRKLWHITLPGIKSTIVILVILRLGTFLDTGFEQIFLMVNAMNRQVGEIFDTYVYEVGVLGGQFSYSAAVGMFKSVVSLILVIASNELSKKMGEEGIF